MTAVLPVVMVAVRLGVIGEITLEQSLDRSVREAFDTAKDANAAHAESVYGAGPYAAADEGVNALVGEESGEGFVSGAGGAHGHRHVQDSGKMLRR